MRRIDDDDVEGCFSEGLECRFVVDLSSDLEHVYRDLTVANVLTAFRGFHAVFMLLPQLERLI